jgi:hypothetical protein
LQAHWYDFELINKGYSEKEIKGENGNLRIYL